MPTKRKPVKEVVEAAPPAPPEACVQRIPVSQIVAGNNDRKQFDAGKLEELAANIQTFGLAQPPTLRPLADGRFEIVAGERRIRAMRDVLGWQAVPAIVKELGDEQAAGIMGAENLSRVNLNPVEEARAFQTRMTQFGWSEAQTAQAFGISVHFIRERLKLLTLHEDVLHFVSTEALGIGHALALVGLDVNRQRIALRVMNHKPSLTLTAFKEIVASLRQQQWDEEAQPMFELELLAQVDAAPEAVRSGKQSRTYAPVNKDLPPVRVRMKDSVGDILDRHIHDLLVQGEDRAAAALGNLYNTLVSYKWTATPALPLLPSICQNEETAEQAAHCLKE